jgi:hypothetical protein
LLVFAMGSGSPESLQAVTVSRLRANSRTMYDPGVQTAISSSISGRPSVGTSASTST